ncbi:MAG: DUF4012 domain-containing protein [Chloroflexi bacterium]|nr:DUF4012 domain-containing protein [Chloroflexota bacterium]
MTDEMTNNKDRTNDVKDKNVWIKRGSLVLILLGIALLVAWGVGVAQTGLALRQHLAQALALTDDPQSLDPAAACVLVHDLQDDVGALRQQAGGLAQLAPSLGWLPKFGGDLRAAPHLLTVADGLTEAGALSCDALEPALAAFGETGAGSMDLSLESVTGLLANEQSKFERALAAVERTQSAWAQVDTASLSPWVADKTTLLEQGLPLLQMGLSAATIAPDLLGIDELRTYLVLVLNEDELRPGGGFITGVGEVRVEAGQVLTMTFRDSYSADDFTQPYPAPPEPFRRYMGIELWVFRDSNWSPDFPTAARKAISLYRPGYDVSVDGVVAIDQRAVQAVVNAIGPLTIAGEDEPVDGSTLMAYIRDAWTPDDGTTDGGWWQRRKSFMGLIANAAWERVQTGQVDWAALAQAIMRLLEQKHVLIYMEHPDAAAMLAEMNWDGAMPKEQAEKKDFLMVLDANMGYNKTNRRVKETITYQIDLRPPSPEAALTLVYTHTSTADYPCKQDMPYEPNYERLMRLCNWNYLRVYVPQGSDFWDATRIPVPDENLLTGEGTSGEVTVQQAEEGPWTTLGVMGVLAPSASQTRYFFWTLPQDVVEWQSDQGSYSLRVQKQPGTIGHPLTVQVRLPEGSVLVDAVPQPTVATNNWVIYRVALDRDREFTLHFEKQHE